MTNDGGPAFPSDDYTDSADTLHFNWSGMSLRDYFAGQALVGLLAHASGEAPSAAPAVAYLIADAMLTARATQERT